MCLSPVFIQNPELDSVRRRIIEVHCADRTIYHPLGVPFYPPSAQKNNVCLSNNDLFYVVLSDGLTLNTYSPVPCRKCFECIEAKQKDIRSRMLLEQLGHDSQTPLFITLTYSDEHLPVGGVSSSDIKYFLKRLHLYLDRAGLNGRFRHCIFSEYSPSPAYRPHYHGILYGIDVSGNKYFPYYDCIVKAWNRGFVKVKIATLSKFMYCSKYVSKDSYGLTPHGLNPNFWLASRRDGGLGLSCLKSIDFFIQCAVDKFPRCTFRILGQPVTVFVPKNIRDRLIDKRVKILPPFIIKQIKNLVLDIRAVRYSVFKDNSNPLGLPLYVPEDIIDKYSYWSRHFDSLYDPFEFDEPLFDLRSEDLIALSYRINRCINDLRNYDLDLDRLNRHIHMSSNIKRAIYNLIEPYLKGLPPASEREISIKSKFLSSINKSS